MKSLPPSLAAGHHACFIRITGVGSILIRLVGLIARDATPTIKQHKNGGETGLANGFFPIDDCHTDYDNDDYYCGFGLHPRYLEAPPIPLADHIRSATFSAVVGITRKDLCAAGA